MGLHQRGSAQGHGWREEVFQEWTGRCRLWCLRPGRVMSCTHGDNRGQKGTTGGLRWGTAILGVQMVEESV